MRSFITLLSIVEILALDVPSAFAGEAASVQELRELRQAVQSQSKQIELLTEQIGRLARTLENPGTVQVSTPTATALPDPARPAADPALEAPRAVAVPDGLKHVVAKGETLTSIAKQYNIPIADLKNANKIENERKLQIGHILTVPTTKLPDISDKKENP